MSAERTDKPMSDERKGLMVHPRVLEQTLNDVADLLRHNPVVVDDFTHKPVKLYCGQPHPRTKQPVRLCVLCSYRWVYNAAIDRTVSDEAKVSTSSSSVVESTLFSKHQLRSACGTAHEALKAVLAAEVGLNRAMDATFGRHGVEAPRTTRDQRLITDEDLQASREAKREREARGLGFGEG